jgi:hypothetical protein
MLLALKYRVNEAHTVNFQGEAQIASAGSNREPPCQRAPLVQEQVGQAGTPSLHVHAIGAGGDPLAVAGCNLSAQNA